mmetsp:Transcript_1737/g.6044  ORF Transcript_1737/g.6044 Transcript_1737/m.6044 type:complete len:335 (+) Transcript_1737:438-1442(+)
MISFCSSSWSSAGTARPCEDTWKQSTASLRSESSGHVSASTLSAHRLCTMKISESLCRTPLRSAHVTVTLVHFSLVFSVSTATSPPGDSEPPRGLVPAAKHRCWLAISMLASDRPRLSCVASVCMRPKSMLTSGLESLSWFAVWRWNSYADMPPSMDSVHEVMHMLSSSMRLVMSRRSPGRDLHRSCTTVHSPSSVSRSRSCRLSTPSEAHGCAWCRVPPVCAWSTRISEPCRSACSSADSGSPVFSRTTLNVSMASSLWTSVTTSAPRTLFPDAATTAATLWTTPGTSAHDRLRVVQPSPLFIVSTANAPPSSTSPRRPVRTPSALGSAAAPL